MHIALLSGGYPPDFDAIGQYTRELGHALTALGHQVRVLTSGDREAQDGEIAVRGVFDPAHPETLRSLPQALSEAEPVDWLVVQYNPFSFGPRGRAPALPEVLQNIRSRIRVAVMAHETFVPLWPIQCAIMRAWQRPQFFRVCRAAHRLFVSTARWATEVAGVSGIPKPILLPVGSNLPVATLNREEARKKLEISADATVVALFGNAHPSRLTGWAGAAARALPEAQVLYVGRDGAIFREACAGVPFRDEGFLMDAEAALRLRAADCLLSPFTDGISARRGSALAALRQGTPVATTSRSWSDPIMLDNPLVFSCPVKAGAGAFCTAALRAKAAADQGLPHFDFDASPFAWPVKAKNMVAAL